MGSVWLAQHLALQSEIAVKFCLAEGVPLPHVAERFQREAALAFRVKSPHVVQILDHGLTGDGIPYIAMELLQGEDLASRIARVGPVDLLTFAEWLSQAADGLSQAHAAGVVHRDIKPSNLFLCRETTGIRVKLLDFGVAKNALRCLAEESHQTAAGALLGTPAFMSPEQAANARDVDFRSDLWSLAAVTYQAITGERPFQGDALTAFGAIARGTFVPPCQLRPGLPAALDAWAAKALAVNPAQRFQSADALAETFVKVVQDAQVAAPWKRLTPRRAALAGFAAAVAGILLIQTLPYRSVFHRAPNPVSIGGAQTVQPSNAIVASAPSSRPGASLPEESAAVFPQQQVTCSAPATADALPQPAAKTAATARARVRNLPQPVPPKRPLRAVHLPSE
jgi:serine/threonine-protein kinase